jgi:hypothetical protein
MRSPARCHLVAALIATLLFSALAHADEDAVVPPPPAPPVMVAPPPFMLAPSAEIDHLRARSQRNTRLGWGFIGAGMALFTGGVAWLALRCDGGIQSRCSADDQAVATLMELGTVVGLGVGIPHAAVGAYQGRKARRLSRLSLAPIGGAGQLRGFAASATITF